MALLYVVRAFAASRIEQGGTSSDIVISAASIVSRSGEGGVCVWENITWSG